MKTYKGASSTLKVSILATFSALLLLSFLLVGTAFNIVIRQYIRSNAVTALEEAKGNHYGMFELSRTGVPLLRIVIGGHRPEFFRTNLQFFIVDTDYQILSPGSTYSADNLAQVLYMRNVAPYDLYNLRINANGNTYYVTSATVPGTNNFAVFYVDVTDFVQFTHSINMLLIYLAAFILIVAIAVTGFLAGTLARPIRILQEFAKQIGNGNFTPNPISFVNEEFEALNQSLNHTAKQLAKYDIDQKTFFQNVSHELRTPLMTIESYAEGIKYGIMDPNKAALTILDATERLSDMVDDAIYISRIDNITTPVMEVCDLRMLIQERMSVHQPIAELKGLSININFLPPKSPIMANCSVSYIGRALDNMIGNAMRFAKNKVYIDCSLIGKRVLIIVKDDGGGFEPEILPHAFERFVKGKDGISGIGLAVVRSIAEQHKGYVKAENIKTGAKVTFDIPTNL